MSETKNAWERVLAARSPSRPTALYYMKQIFEGFIELHGDRAYRDDASIVGGVALFRGIPVTVIGEEKGNGIAERAKRNFGSPHPEGYRKALRLMQQAQKFNRPIICLVDTQGAYCGVGAEERGQGEAIARNLRDMMALTVPVISIIIGEGGSGGALALGVANRVVMLENAIYSILSPEGFAAILWRDSSRAEEAAGVMKITAVELRELGLIDDVIPESGDPAETAAAMADLIAETLEVLRGEAPKELAAARYRRFRAF